MEDTDLQFFLIAAGVIALAGYKYFIDKQITMWDIIYFAILLVVICSGYLLLYFLIKKLAEYNYKRDLEKSEQRIKNKKEREKENEKEAIIQHISKLHEKHKELQLIFLQEPSAQKLGILEQEFNKFFQMEGLLYEEVAQVHHKIAIELHEEINKTKAHLQREKEAQKIQIDLTKGIYKESELKPEQIELLKQHSYARSRHVPLGQSGPVNYYLKPRFNESPVHFFMIMNIKEHLEAKNMQVTTPTTRDADIIFTVNNQTWAIEVETGSVKTKTPEVFKQKIEQLNKRYGKNWFIVLTKKDMIKHYRSKRYNIIKKNKIIEKLNEITGPPKSGLLKFSQNSFINQDLQTKNLKR